MVRGDLLLRGIPYDDVAAACRPRRRLGIRLHLIANRRSANTGPIVTAPLPPPVRSTVSSRLLARLTDQPQFSAFGVIVKAPVPAAPPVNVMSSGQIWNVQADPPVPAWSTVTV
jgi:hypothetical protein